MTRDSVISEVVADLTIELQNDVDFNADILGIKVKNVYREIVTRRCYENSNISGNDDAIASDVYNNFYHVLMKVSRFDYNQIGVEGEESHTENGIVRHYTSRDKLFGDIFPYVKVL